MIPRHLLTVRYQAGGEVATGNKAKEMVWDQIMKSFIFHAKWAKSFKFYPKSKWKGLMEGNCTIRIALQVGHCGK